MPLKVSSREYNMIPQLIQKYGLHRGVTREVSFYVFVSIVPGYTKHLREKYGFSYRAVGVSKQGTQWLSLVNDAYVGKKTEEFLQKHKNFSEVLRRIERLLPEYKRQIELIRKTAIIDQKEALQQILDFFPKYFGDLGFLNYLYRYLGNNNQTSLLSPELVARIGQIRNPLGELYHHVDNIFVTAVLSWGTQ